jgi:hypothetical protein
MKYGIPGCRLNVLQPGIFFALDMFYLLAPDQGKEVKASAAPRL